MLKPNGYEDVQVGEFTPVQVGGHHLIIKQVREDKTKKGDDMLVVAFDFAANDAQPNYFADQFNKDIRPDKKWPYTGIAYVVATDNTGMTSRNFKTFIKSFEDSNRTVVKWGDGPAFCDQFKGKKIGGVFGRVEYQYLGERRIKVQFRWFCEDSKAETAKVPADKMLPEAPAQTAPVTADVTIDDDSLPF